MPERSERRAFERSCRLYQRLLKFYPNSHREEYGPAMLQLFRDQCRDAWTARRTRGLIVLWLCVFPDLLKTSVLEHLSNLNWRKSMLFRSQFRPLAVFLSIFASVFLLTLLTSALIAFLTPDSFRSTALFVVGENLPGTQPSASSSDAYFLQTELGVIQSHPVLSKAVDALNLRDLWATKFNRGAPLSTDRAETILRRRIDLKRVRNTKIIEISAFSDHPDEAAQLAYGVVEAYRAYRAEEARAMATGASNNVVPLARPVTIIQPAIPELRPFRPNRPLIIALGIIIGSVLGSIAGALSVGMVTLLGGPRNPTPTPAAPLHSFN